MFVHSAEFVERHDKTVNDEISIYGVEKDRVRVIPQPVLHPPVLPVRAIRVLTLVAASRGDARIQQCLFFLRVCSGLADLRG